MTQSAIPNFTLSSSSLRALLLFLVAGVLFFVGLGGLPLLEPDEGRNAEVAREMLVTGDWITPHFNTLTYLDKPAGFFWLVAASFRIWGISEWAARLPSALMALATMLLTWVLARRMFDDSTGFRAGIILATSPLAMALSRLVTFDMTLTFFVTLAMASFWVGENQEVRSAGPDVLMFGAMGAATITKGPVGFLLPLLSILAYQAMRGRFRDLKRLRWGLGLGVFLAVVLPWFVAVSVRNPDFPRYALWQESLQRFATGHARRTGALVYYVPVYLAGFFPWSLFLLFVGWNRLKGWRELREDTQKSVTFSLAWASVVFVSFSISQSKLPAYFLPALIPLSILMAQVWADVGSPGSTRPPDWLTAGFAAMLGVGLLVALVPRLALLGTLQFWVERKLHPSVVALMKPSLLYSGLILVAVAVIGRNLAARSRGFTLSVLSFALLALTMPLLVLRWVVPLKTYAATVSSRRVADTIKASPEKDLPLYGYYYFRTSLPFYLRRPVGLVTADASETTSNYVPLHLSGLPHRAGASGPSTFAAGRETQPAAAGRSLQAYPLLIDSANLGAIASLEPILVMARNTHVGRLGPLVGRIEPLWVDWQYSVWKISGSKFERQK